MNFLLHPVSPSSPLRENMISKNSSRFLKGKILFSVNKRQGVIGQKLEFHKVGGFRSRYFEFFC